MTRITVVVADDHFFVAPGILDTLNKTPDMQVVGETTEINDVLKLVRDKQPNVIVLDLYWPPDRKAGLRLIPEIRKASHDTQIVAISVYPDLIEAAGRAGVYTLEKGFSKERLLSAIRWAVQSKDIPISIPASARLGALTTQEVEVLKLMARGRTNKGIGEELGIVEGTVKKHVQNILDKLSASNRAEAVAIAQRSGLV
jgi:DNA-binding NarL/FixJ family response regulator